MAKLYKYNGAWETYQYLHDDVGFNTEPTNSVSFKSVGYGHKSWGDSDGSGYALDTNDITDIEYFRSGSHGWYDLNALASSLHVYPANATDCQMTNGTVTSDAVMLTFSDATLVLIALGKSYGWKTIDEWAESGWILNALPTVSISGNFGNNNWLDNGAQSTPTSVSPDSVVTLYIRNLTEIPVYDVTKSYGIIQWQTTAGTTAGRTEFAIVESSGNIAAKNVSSSTLSFYTTRIAVCSSSDATVVTVYDSSNNAYNAFKYTSSGTDYYYVLDGSQTDWTDDLASIGYSLTPIEETLKLILGMRSTGSDANDWKSVTYSAGDSFWSGIRNENEHYEAEKFGLQVHTNKWAGNIGGILMDYTYSAEILMVYSDIGGNNAVTPMVDGWVMVSDYVSSVTFVYFGSSNTEGFSTPTMAYYAKFTKHSSAEVEAYSSGSSGVSVNPSGVASIYDVDGYNIWFDSGKKYTLIGVYRPDGGDITSAFKLVARRRTSTPYFSYLAIMNITTTIYPFRRAVIKIEDLNEREAWFKSDKSDYYFNSSYSVLYNTYGEQFVENFERRFEIIRFEDANGNIVTPGSGSLYFTQGTGNVFRLSRSGVPAFTAAKVVYRSLPFTKRAWLRTNHTGKDLASGTSYYLYDDDGNTIAYDGIVALGTANAILAIFNSSKLEVDRNNMIFQKYTHEGVEYLVLTNNGTSVKEDVAYIIYKES